MTSLSKIMLQVGIVASCLCNGVMASYIDFTDDISLTPISGGFQGSVDGIGFTLTSSIPGVNRTEGYDGDTNNPGCQDGGGSLRCLIDGVGIDNDEITMGQTLSLSFDTAVRITRLEFLDLYVGGGVEQATVSIDGTLIDTVDATGSSGDGGYAKLDLGGLILGLGQNIELTAALGEDFWDDRTNDYAFAAVTVSAVPVPAAFWLFGTALIGFVGMSRRRKVA
jgi:hypothetical protein